MSVITHLRPGGSPRRQAGPSRRPAARRHRRRPRRQRGALATARPPRPGGRRPVRLVVCDLWEAWVVGWTPGQHVDVHDHGDSAGVLVVVEGDLVEVLPAGPAPACSAPGRPVTSSTSPWGSCTTSWASARVRPRASTCTPRRSGRSPTTTTTAVPSGSRRPTTSRPSPTCAACRRALHPSQQPWLRAPSTGSSRRPARGLDRVQPDDLAAEQAAGALVVDIRPEPYRLEEGELPGAVVVDRNHLEWWLDPTSDAAVPRGHARPACDHRLQRGLRVEPRRRDPPAARCRMPPTSSAATGPGSPAPAPPQPPSRVNDTRNPAMTSALRGMRERAGPALGGSRGRSGGIWPGSALEGRRSHRRGASRPGPSRARRAAPPTCACGLGRAGPRPRRSPGSGRRQARPATLRTARSTALLAAMAAMWKSSDGAGHVGLAGAEARVGPVDHRRRSPSTITLSGWKSPWHTTGGPSQRRRAERLGR